MAPTAAGHSARPIVRSAHQVPSKAAPSSSATSAVHVQPTRARNAAATGSGAPPSSGAESQPGRPPPIHGSQIAALVPSLAIVARRGPRWVAARTASGEGLGYGPQRLRHGGKLFRLASGATR
ncbi:MAG: hypothetical protein B7Z68_07150 [Acidobacteria bacterium 21-70-11]|nr:MAG: hypothetical protein B7Z68_07150 [Acidobacteria bacterium 21-70-11]